MKTSTYLPLFSGFYGSIWSEQDFCGEEDYYKIPEGMYFDDFVDWQSYYNAIAEKYCEYVEESLGDFVNEIKYEKVGSPRYYNCSNDWIECEIDFNRELIELYILDNFNEFEKYIQENYTSRDGFHSFYENDARQWTEGWESDQHKVGSVLNFICKNEGIEEPYYFDDLHISMYYTEDILPYYINDDCE